MKNTNLHNIESSGFKTPNDYFESFEADFFEHLKEKEAITSSEASGFTVPENYFDSVEGKILEKLQHKTETPVINLKPKSRFYYFVGIAATIVLLFSLGFNNDNITIDTLDTEILESYLYQEDYTNDDFASLFKFDDISVIDFIDINVSDEALNHYFEKIETEDLIFE